MTTLKPSMKLWEEAWATANEPLLQSVYAVDGRVCPPNHAILQGPAILDFFRGGFEAVVVRFTPEELVVADTLAFEFGVSRDFAHGTEKLVETGHYAITWVLENGEWKIKFHTWTIPLPA